MMELYAGSSSSLGGMRQSMTMIIIYYIYIYIYIYKYISARDEIFLIKKTSENTIKKMRETIVEVSVKRSHARKKK